jgi:hypothetical protein
MAASTLHQPALRHAPRPRNTFRPVVEQLEDRTTPASGPLNLADPTLISLHLNPLDIRLLGLEVETSAIQVNISAEPGPGKLLGNLLTDATSLLNVAAVNNALNNVLGSVVNLLDSGTLLPNSINFGGPLAGTPKGSSTLSVLNLFVAPVHLDLLGAVVDTSPIDVTILAHKGPGQILGNVVTDLANLFNPPVPKLNINTINTALGKLIKELNAALPGIPGAPVATPALAGHQILALSVPPLDVNLLGLILTTSQIQVNVTAQTGKGELLGNVLTGLLDTLGATPASLRQLNRNLNTLLGKVVGLLNEANLLLPPGSFNALTPVLQELGLANLVNPSGTASTPILNLIIASSDGMTPPVNVNLLGLQVTTSNIHAQLVAQTGNGLLLGNLLYNVANLLNPGGSIGLLSLLTALGG